MRFNRGTSVIAGTITPGNLYLFIESINLFWFPLISIASFWSQFQQGLSAAERVFALIDAEANPGQVQEAEGGKDLEAHLAGVGPGPRRRARNKCKNGPNPKKNQKNKLKKIKMDFGFVSVF